MSYILSFKLLHYQVVRNHVHVRYAVNLLHKEGILKDIFVRIVVKNYISILYAVKIYRSW